MLARANLVLSASLFLTPCAIAQTPSAPMATAQVARTVDAHRVVPVIRGQREIDALAPDVRQGLALSPFVGVLYVLLAEDTGGTIRYLTNDEVGRLGWPQDDVKVNALINMTRLLPRFQIRGSDGFFMIFAGGNYESSLLLATPMWEKLRSELKGEPVMGIPNRDMFIVTGSRDKENLATLRQLVDDSYAKGDFPITRELILLGREGFSVFKEAQ